MPDNSIEPRLQVKFKSCGTPFPECVFSCPSLSPLHYATLRYATLQSCDAIPYPVVASYPPTRPRKENLKRETPDDAPDPNPPTHMECPILHPTIHPTRILQTTGFATRAGLG